MFKVHGLRNQLVVLLSSDEKLVGCIAGRAGIELGAPGNDALRSVHLCIRILYQISYLKLWNHIYIYIYSVSKWYWVRSGGAVFPGSPRDHWANYFRSWHEGAQGVLAYVAGFSFLRCFSLGCVSAANLPKVMRLRRHGPLVLSGIAGILF